jgi:mono/diheme cytochrome c family protein
VVRLRTVNQTARRIDTLGRPTGIVKVVAIMGSVVLLIGAASLRLAAQSQKTALQNGSQSSTPQRSLPESAPIFVRTVAAKYCVACHNSKSKVAGLDLSRLDLAHLGDDAETWEKVAGKLRTREMPPPGMPRPDPATFTEVVNQLETALDSAAAVKPNPARVPVHRLNRSEYTNAIRDLLGFEIDGRTLLSSDNSDQEGFDNVASVLSVSPALIEDYLSAARAVSRVAVGDTSLIPGIDTFKFSKLLIQDEQMNDDLPLGSQGGASIRYHFPLDAEYTIKIRLRRQEYDYLIGMGEPHQIDIRLDGVLLRRFSVGGEAKGMTTPESFAGNTPGDPEFEKYLQTADAGLETRVPVTAGDHQVGISFVRRFWAQEGVLQPPQTGFGRTTNEYYHGNPAVEFVYIGGPYGRVSTGDSTTRRRIFICNPKSVADEEPCANRILSTLAQRAYRRPLTNADVQTLLGSYREGRVGQSFDTGIRQGIERMLVSPSFLFRIEREPAKAAACSACPLRPLDLASRLSFFLWASIPDDELLNAALGGTLQDPAVLAQQVRRMLRDSRSQALVENFASRWLELNKLSGLVPDSAAYPEFDENLRDAMKQETQLFIASQLREDRSVLELLTADYTFLNERLAKHYGIPDVYGNHFRRVTFADGRRGGLLGQASVLAVTSYPNRTSVAIRGRWLLANMFGSPPPPPPADVPDLKAAGVDGQPLALRQRMELHRKNVQCASCHRRMDPMGFSLENFDALGKWRNQSDGAPVDASASLPDGTHFDGLPGLRTLMTSHQEDFVRTLTSKLLAYAIGRGIEYTDLPAIREISRDSAKDDYRWSSLLFGVVNSAPFKMGSSSGEQQPQSSQR